MRQATMVPVSELVGQNSRKAKKKKKKKNNSDLLSALILEYSPSRIFSRGHQAL